MKKLIIAIGLACVIALPATAQTNISLNLPSVLTNAEAVVYGTYAPSAPSGYTKIGGGALVFYNFGLASGVQVAPGIGFDWLGSASLVSANVTLKATTHPLSFLGATGSKIGVTPNVLMAIGTGYSGLGTQNGQVFTAEGVGASLSYPFGNWSGALGAELVNRTSAGPYSGRSYNIFLGFRYGW